MGEAAVDVLVVGAGPTGLTLAAELVRHGVVPRVVDRSADRVHESRALAIQPRSLEVLAPLGVAGALVDAGNRAVALRVHAGRRDVAVPLFDLGYVDTAYPYLLFLSQAETERVLEARLRAAGVEVHRRVELVGLRPGEHLVEADLRHAEGAIETMRARYVVGCDGAHSGVRTAAGIPFEGGSYPQTFVLADCEAEGVQPGAAHAFLSGRGMLFFFPLGSPASWRLLAMRAPDDPTPAEAAVAIEEIQGLVNAYTGGRVRLHDPVWMTNFRLHHRAARHYRAGRVFLAGDAAHIHSPAGGQGMNTGIQDSVNLAWKLAHTLRGLARPALLDTYEAERVPIGRTVLRFTDRAFRVATSTKPLVRVARTRVAPLVLPLLLRPRRLRGYAFRTVSQLAVHYGGSPLSTNGPGHAGRGPAAGHRLPDAAVLRDGRPSRLHDVVAPPCWHLLVLGDELAAACERLSSRYGDLRVHRIAEPGAARGVAIERADLQRLGLTRPAGLLLVRPDGYIGYRGGSSGLSGLAQYLERWLTS
jgi:2-polyprenyl-6-methoxyphenol hydroxylase-like FAD-dependent oxidoreductase